MVYAMKVFCVNCQDCGHLNQIPGSDPELHRMPDAGRTECHKCGSDLNFEDALIEDYQAKTASAL